MKVRTTTTATGRWGWIAVVFLLVLLPAAASAQEEGPAAVVAEAEVEVTMAADGSDSVEATYTVQATGDSIGDIEHVIVRRPGAEIENIAVSGEIEGSPAPEGGEGIERFVLSASGKEATYSVSYDVTRHKGVFAVPLVIPNLPADAAGTNVTITTRLPEGEELTGEFFPTVDDVQEAGSVLTTRVTNLPSVVIAEYAGGAFSLSDWITWITVVIFAAVVIGWYAGGAKEARLAKEAIA